MAHRSRSLLEIRFISRPRPFQARIHSTTVDGRRVSHSNDPLALEMACLYKGGIIIMYGPAEIPSCISAAAFPSPRNDTSPYVWNRFQIFRRVPV